MITALLHSGTEKLMVFATDPADDRLGPYQELALPLLALPDGAVRWLIAHPSGGIVDIPARFVGALLDGEVDEATRLLAEAIDLAAKENSV